MRLLGLFRSCSSWSNFSSRTKTRQIARVWGRQSAQGTLCSRHERSTLAVPCLIKTISWEAGDAGAPQPAALPLRRSRPHPNSCGPAHLSNPHLSKAHRVALPGAKAPEPRGPVCDPPPEPGHRTDSGKGAKHSHRALAHAHVRTALVPPAPAPPPQRVQRPVAPEASREL